ncbi:hypothetical protein [Methylotenera sp.]|uniref:hypothetical protein n=1 Tax=Methylotenera sp. TaxID=2051956 RepID=UPI00248964F9|nr:hypothetical protein [Methylotenera sp.]MDI1360648.1 hypothetical protein [Methylotenera sp.]
MTQEMQLQDDSIRFKNVESLMGVARISFAEAIMHTQNILNPELKQDAITTLQGGVEDLINLFKGDKDEPGTVKVVPPFVSQNDNGYIDVDTYVRFEDYDWKFTVSLRKQDGDVTGPIIQTAKHPDGEFDISDTDVPEDVSKAWYTLHADAVNLLNEAWRN